MFTRLGKVPDFELLSVGFGRVTGDGQGTALGAEDSFSQPYPERKQLWRKFKLGIEDFECDILEVFPDRGMFVAGESWLDNAMGAKDGDLESYPSTVNYAKVRGSTNRILLMALLCLLAFELWMFFVGRAVC